MNKIFTILFLATTILSFGQNSKMKFIQFDGVYETECEYEEDDNEGTQGYLRFYSDGKVISISTDCEGPASDLKDWFHIGYEYVSIGNYKINKRKIQFSTTSKSGTVNYIGRITKYGLIKLKSKSLINGYSGREKYKFVKINDLK